MLLKGKSIYPVFPKINSPKKTLSAETRTLILNNKVKYGEVCYIIDNIYGMEPLIQYSEGNDLITYVRKDGYYYRGKNYEGLDVASYDISEMLSQGSDSHLFVTMMKEKEIYSNCYLNYILDEHLDKLKDFSGNIKERKIDISYTEIYICRPVDCILLIQLIKQFIRDYKFEINKLIIKTGDKDNLFGRNSYNGTKETLNDKFLNADDRNEFLKECIEEILGEDCDYEIITNEKLPHYRLLTIDNDEFELTLNPDGGLGFGLKYWGRDDAESLEFKGKGLKLVNTISLNNDHIRLTMG